MRLKARFLTSFSRIASRMDETVPNTRLMTLMASVLRMLLMKSSRPKSHWKFFMPTHLLPQMPALGL